MKRASAFHVIQEARSAVRENKLARGPAHLLLALATYANKEGSCYPSVGTLAADCGISVRTASRDLRQLKEAGLVTCRRRRGTSAIWTLHPTQRPAGHPTKCETPASGLDTPPATDIEVSSVSAKPQREGPDKNNPPSPPRGESEVFAWDEYRLDSDRQRDRAALREALKEWAGRHVPELPADQVARNATRVRREYGSTTAQTVRDFFERAKRSEEAAARQRQADEAMYAAVADIASRDEARHAFSDLLAALGVYESQPTVDDLRAELMSRRSGRAER